MAELLHLNQKFRIRALSMKKILLGVSSQNVRYSVQSKLVETPMQDGHQIGNQKITYENRRIVVQLLNCSTLIENLGFEPEVWRKYCWERNLRMCLAVRDSD